MNSIGIYVPTKPNADVIDLIQINFWNISSSNGSVIALDIALMLPKEYDDIYLSVPFNVSDVKNDIQDLGVLLKEKVLKTVFNDNSTNQELEDNIRIITREQSKKDSFYLRELKVPDDFSVVQDDAFEDNVSLIKIDLKSHKNKLTELGKQYIRFRLRLKGINAFAYEERISSDALQSTFVSAHLFDFRINDSRAINEHVSYYMSKKTDGDDKEEYQLAKFKKIQFFYMSDIEEEYSCGTSPSSFRLLESKSWNSYFEDIDDSKQYLAYYWKTSSDDQISEYNLFFKTLFCDIKKKRLGIYIAFIILFGAWGSFLVTALQTLDGNKFPFITFGILILITIALVYFHNKNK